MEIPEFLSYLWQCEDVNGLLGFGINRGLLICPLYSHHISNGQFGIKSHGQKSPDRSGKNYLPSLLVVPASLLSNWENELDRFAPGLVYSVLHPGASQERKMEFKDPDSLRGVDLVMTTYSLAHKCEWLYQREWNYIILDEAQAIKNPGAKQTRSIKMLKAQNRIAMTGTPVENRLSDLWSLFDFINPGLLGSVEEFGRFAKGLHQSPEGYGKLRRIISPYILRRLKTDKAVISDLPEKVEMKTYASLSKRQLLLYKEMVRELKETVEQTEGIQRKGLILS